MNLPEHEKLKEIQPTSQEIGDFIEWLGEQGIWLSRLDRFDRFQPINENRDRLLAQYFEIDLDVLEKEKLALLDSLRG